MMYTSAKLIREKYVDVTSQTLRRWSDNGLISRKRFTPTGKYKYFLPDIVKLCSQTNDFQDVLKKKKIIYARVSSSKQKEDLQRQIEMLRRNYPNHEVYSDVGSGLNYKRKGFISILELSLQGNVEEVVVAHRDRLCRFGFEFFEWFFKQTRGKLLVHSKDEMQPKSREQELAEDLLSIVTVFAARHHGKRSYSDKTNSNLS